ncbi:hypothetical protein AJ85_12755 [Alkalihalobacillus alcalophilus ATCC 27647 = CGMCC 1.3604]|uniref:Uncharacterized protein n=1 Tax=Alkalihalobacillus alcalophilus ATCC 27647 = CGMCC 1.3604 TaxID=1218173 RepID=A0A4S4K2C0_ALKAL|nr:hypothetical protein AJ85_12755 [Alkalihalobacillus alcalophilus ATCC 27647 = CGMCC 1.3604]
MYRENIGEAEILTILKELLPHYTKERNKEEYFGNYLIRAEVIKATTDGTNFHQ